MAVVIRLQGLSVTAGSEDIRRFFTGLRIPDGGVHIIGGELDEAFIIFASDEDARRAMTRSGGLIKDSPVTLVLSSKAEMQNVLERTTLNVELDQKRPFEDGARHVRRAVDPEVGRRSRSRSGYSPSSQQQWSSKAEDFFGVFLNGLPFSVTEGQITDFFSGLFIEEIVLLKNPRGQNNGRGFVRFATREDTVEALKRDRNYIGSRYVEVKATTLNDWNRALGKMPLNLNPVNNFERGRSPVHSQRNPQHHDRSRSPMSQRPGPFDEEYCVMLENISFAMEKKDVKQLFRNAKLENDQILFLKDGDGRKSRSAFVLFRSTRDYCEALSQERREFMNRWIYTQPISRENMLKLLKSQNMAVGPPGNSERSEERPPLYPKDSYDSEKACVFVRNLPFDVRKVEIIDFFFGFKITEDKVWILHDHRGAGVGQALILFGSEKEAMEALSLNGTRFLGSEVMMKCVSRSQMKQLAAEPFVSQESLPREESYLGRSSKPFCPPGDPFFLDARISKDRHLPMTNMQDRIHGASDYEPRLMGSRSPQNRGDGLQARFESPGQRFDGPTCVQLLNLPFQIRTEEIYDFCHGYRIIPGSVSLQYDQMGKPKGSATLVFESRQEALTAVKELGGRPIGPRKIQVLLV